MEENEIVRRCGVTEEEWERMLELSHARRQRCHKGEMVLRCGDRGRELGLVEQGSVNIETVDLSGTRSILGHISRGQVFAETYAFCQEVLMVDVTAADQSPSWEEAPCPERNAMELRVQVPLLVRLRDRQGCLFTARASLEETLRLRLCCPEQDCWRGRIYLQAAARLCGNACPCDGDGCCPARLELCLEGFLLLPCAAMPPAPACPADPRPWYPQFSK